ncbi:MAG: hypothetical protein EOO88_23720 [Pedobacter sp.]|nr:MAG: hypothetical protein EOO88_23720 [Pedobacter sp.]
MPSQIPVHDFAGIGIGPFNLGLAALTATVPGLQGVFFDTKPQFSWHPGMLLDFSKMQVPFMADLVTGVDPTSSFSYLAYLKKHNRLYQFVILEDNYITRKEYAAYCSWVADQLPALRFGHTVLNVRYLPEQSIYALEVKAGETLLTYHARHLVIGIGSSPYTPPGMPPNTTAGIIHSSQYLEHQSKLYQSASSCN